jgi:hypothetical protein
MKPGVIRLFAAIFVILVLEGGARAADEKAPAAEVQDAFKRFATAVKDDKYEEASRWIAPPADKVWGREGVRNRYYGRKNRNIGS